MKKNRLGKQLTLLAVRPLVWLHTVLTGDLEQHRQWNRRISQVKGSTPKLLSSGISVPMTREEARDLESQRFAYSAGMGLLRTAMVGSFVLAAAVMTYDSITPTNSVPVLKAPQQVQVQVLPRQSVPIPYVQPPKLALDHAIQGYYHQINQEYQAALSQYDEALKVHPNYSDVYWNKALIHHQMGNYTKAIQSYQQMLRINPNDTDALYNMGYAMDKLGRYGEAIQVYDQILSVDSTDRHAPIGKGISQYHMGDYDAAIAEFAKVMDTNPRYSLYNMACMYSVKGDVEQALHFLERAVPHMDQDMLDWAKQDPDFEAIRNLPRFQDLVYGD